MKKCGKAFANFVAKGAKYLSGVMTTLIAGAKGLDKLIASTATPTPIPTTILTTTPITTTSTIATTSTTTLQSLTTATTASLTTDSTTSALANFQAESTSITSAATSVAPPADDWLSILRDAFLSKPAWGILGATHFLKVFFDLHFAAKSQDRTNQIGHGLSALGSI
jgi:hypothetical protein